MTGHSTARNLLAQGCRWFIGLTLLATGVGKLLDIPGFVNVLITYQAVPELLLYPVAVGFIATELMLAGWLFSGRWLSEAGLASALLHMLFTVVTVISLMRGLDIPNCGCFGVFLARPLDGWTVFEDLVMVGLSLTLFAMARRTNSSKS